MAWEIPGEMDGTRAAGADLSSKQFYFVKLHTDGTVILCAATTDVPYGVLQNKPTSGQTASVMVSGISKVVGGADLDAAQFIGPDGNGKARANVPGTDTTKYIAGQVIEGNTADGGLVTAKINCQAPHRAA
jgi:hypothetical protein